MDKKLLTVSPSPHVRREDNVSTIMCDVIIALVPSLIWGAYIFGLRALCVTLISVFSCVVSESAIRLILKKRVTIGDLSAVVTGLLIAFTLPAACPLWMPVVGGVIAMAVKQAFGGIGKNLLNPAVTARVILGFFPQANRFTLPLEKLPVFNSVTDITYSQTALDSLITGVIPPIPQFDMLIGNRVGALGEVSALLLLAGGLYLLARRIISLHIPLAFMGAVTAVAYLFPMNTFKEDFMLFHLLCGSVVLGAVFLATDCVTSPVSGMGKIIFGAGCGLITMVARYWGGFDGVFYGILIMNVLTPHIDKLFVPRPFGSEIKKKS